MTIIELLCDNKKNVVGFSVKGHSGYAESGSDIVCSAVSACVQMLELGMVNILGKQGEFSLYEQGDDIEVSFSLAQNLDGQKREKCLELTKMFCQYMTQLEKQYEKYIKTEKRRV